MTNRRRTFAFAIIAACGVWGLLLLHTVRRQVWLSRTGSTLRRQDAGATPQTSPPLQLKQADLRSRNTTDSPILESHFTWHVGGPTPEGDFVFADWEAGHLALLSDYGFMLINEGTYEHPKAIYLLGYRNQKRVRVCRSLPAFKKALKDIPRNTKVYLHTVCTTGTYPGMHAETWEPIESAFRAAHLRFDKEDCVRYCICDPSADPYPDVPRKLRPAYVHLYGEATFVAHARR
jgi:hypothetical protein